jgi:predicted nuclease of restriction endonuclease-like (RecB) superfamily
LNLLLNQWNKNEKNKTNEISKTESKSYEILKDQIKELLIKGRRKAYQSINTILLQTYWSIGKYIVEYEQKGNIKAKYGEELLKKLSKDLTIEFGKGFSKSNLFQMRAFYLRFSKFQTLSGKLEIPSYQLSWSHYVELLKIDDDLELNFYVKQCEKEKWSVRELKRQMKSMLFHRIALSKNKKEIIELSKSGQEISKPDDILKDPYVFEFLDIPQQRLYLEGELEKRLIDNLEKFLLELGKGFAFVGRQYKISIGNRLFYVDLVFYHRILKCFVLIDLKRGEVEHNDIGQMNLYLNYFAEEENTEDDNPPIGIILGAYKDKILVEYATKNISNHLFVSKYQLYLPNKKELQRELQKLIKEEENE